MVKASPYTLHVSWKRGRGHAGGTQGHAGGTRLTCWLNVRDVPSLLHEVARFDHVHLFYGLRVDNFPAELQRQSTFIVRGNVSPWRHPLSWQRVQEFVTWLISCPAGCKPSSLRRRRNTFNACAATHMLYVGRAFNQRPIVQPIVVKSLEIVVEFLPSDNVSSLQCVNPVNE